MINLSILETGWYQTSNDEITSTQKIVMTMNHLILKLIVC